MKANAWVPWVLVLLPYAPTSAAQEPTLIGERVRLHASGVSNQRLVGRVVSESPTTLTLTLPTGERTLERQAIRGLEVSRGPGHKGRGALIGGLVGAAVGIGVGVAANSCDQDDIVCISSEGMALGAVLILAPVGAGIGALVTPGERWEAADPARVRVSAGPARGGGFQARLAIAF